jgi:hypothetical protein
VVQVANDTYPLEEPSVQWQVSNRLEWDGFRGEGTKRYKGFEAGNRVTALGRVVAGNEGHVIPMTGDHPAWSPRAARGVVRDPRRFLAALGMTSMWNGSLAAHAMRISPFNARRR